MVIKNASQKPNVVCFFCDMLLRCSVPQKFLQNQVRIASKLKVKCMGSRSFLLSSEAGPGFGLWASESWQYRTFTRRRQKAVGRLPCSPGPLSSNLPGGALEVCHAEVGGWRGSVRVFLRGWMFVCCVCVSVKWEDTRVGFCCIRWPKCKLPFEANFAFAYRCPVVPQTQDICSFEYR